MERWLDGSPAMTLGKPIEIMLDTEYSNMAKVIPIMEIRTPKGGMILYDNPSHLNIQCKAIRAFMKQHRNEM